MNWPFADPPNVAVLTSADVVDRGMPIVYVSHDADDGAWQFHSRNGAPAEEQNARVVGLKTIFELDSSIGLLADLQLGWFATRSTVGEPWKRQRSRT